MASAGVVEDQLRPSDLGRRGRLRRVRLIVTRPHGPLGIVGGHNSAGVRLGAIIGAWVCA
jgi:hypothetical protein